MKCISCGRESHVMDALFCNACGSSLADPESSSSTQDFSVCNYCDFRGSCNSDYCGRCGADLAEDFETESLKLQFQNLRIVLRNRTFETLFGNNFTINRIRKLQKNLAPFHHQPWVQEESISLADDLYMALDSCYVAQIVNIASECKKRVLPMEIPDYLDTKISKLSNFAKAIIAGNNSFAKGELQSGQATKWLETTIGSHEVNRDFAFRYLRTIPEYWPNVVQQAYPAAWKFVQPRLACQTGIRAISKKNHELAIELLEKAHQQYPDYTPIMEALGQANLRLENQQIALGYYEKAIEAGTIDPMTYNNFAWYKSNSPGFSYEDETKTLAAAKRAVELAPVSTYYDTLANVLQSIGRHSEAIQVCRICLLEEPEHETYRERMIELVEEIESEKESMFDFENDDQSEMPQNAHSESQPVVNSGSSEDPNEKSSSFWNSLKNWIATHSSEEIQKELENLVGSSNDSISHSSTGDSGSVDPVIPSGSMAIPNESKHESDYIDVPLYENDDFDLALSADSEEEELGSELDSSSGINLSMPADSGLSLEDEPMDAGDDSISALELPEDDEENIFLDEESDFMLSTSDDDFDEEESGSQIIALDDEIYEDEDDDGVFFAGEDFADAEASIEASFDYAASGSTQIPATSMDANENNQSPTPSAIDSEANEVRLNKRFDKSSAEPSQDYGKFHANSTARDKVDCSVFAPNTVAPKDEFLVHVYVHLPKQSKKVDKKMAKISPQSQKKGCESLGTELERGSRLKFRLASKAFEIDEAEEELTWQGEPVSVQFMVSVPSSAELATRVLQLHVLQDDCPIGKIKFEVQVSDQGGDIVNVPTGLATRYQKAFLSYSSKDIDKVRLAVQTLERIGIDYFLDQLRLKPGEPWEKAIYQQIEDCDVLFLFWSTSARKSKYVKKEWKFAVNAKGDDIICPFPIEGPPLPTPPKRLAHIHFGDPILYSSHGR